MNNVLKHSEEILDRQVCGFHRYVLTSPVHIDFVSQNLCELTGITKDELLEEKNHQ